MAIQALVLRKEDNVATAVAELQAGQSVDVRVEEEVLKILVQEDIPYGHKFAVREIVCGEDILKYGEVIGRATKLIQQGCHAHVQNIESLRGRGDLGSKGVEV